MPREPQPGGWRPPNSLLKQMSIHVPPVADHFLQILKRGPVFDVPVTNVFSSGDAHLLTARKQTVRVEAE